MDTVLTLDRFFAPLSGIIDQAEFRSQWNLITDDLLKEIESALKSKDEEWVRGDPSGKECWLKCNIRSLKYYPQPVIGVIPLHLYWDKATGSWVLAAFDKDKGPKFFGNTYKFIHALAIDLFGRTCGD